MCVNCQPAYGAITGEASDATLTLSDVKDLGRIRVVWQRINWGQKTLHYANKELSGVSEVSEKVLKGKSIENAIKLCNPQTYCSTRILMRLQTELSSNRDKACRDVRRGHSFTWSARA